jgi:1-acyl-sn-glycerol-3-phosphate acyltransferase
MRWLSYRIMTLLGWRFVGKLPDEPKMVVIAGPHTSNWDFFIFLAALEHFEIKARFLGKRSLFRWPFGWMFRKVGGIPVDRSKSGGIVGQVKAAFDASNEMILVIAPEGTRQAAPRWKSGFVEIADHANVPVVCAGVNAMAKTVTMSEAYFVGDSRKAFMDQIRAFYAPMNGINPQGAGPVRIAGEDA